MQMRRFPETEVLLRGARIVAVGPSAQVSIPRGATRVDGSGRYLMPGLADTTGLPSTRMVLSEYDDLRSSGELYAAQLAEQGVPVELTVAQGMLHGHLNLPPVNALAKRADLQRSVTGQAHAAAQGGRHRIKGDCGSANARASRPRSPAIRLVIIAGFEYGHRNPTTISPG